MEKECKNFDYDALGHACVNCRKTLENHREGKKFSVGVVNTEEKED